MHFFSLLSPPRNLDIMHLDLVPQRFIQILKGSLAKMAGEEMIPRDFVDADFWSKFPTRFNQKKYNETSKVNK